MPNKDETISKMSQIHTIFLYEILKKVCKTKGEKAIYREGQSDVSVLEAANVKAKADGLDFVFTSTQVAGLRRTMFGHVANGSRAVGDKTVGSVLINKRLAYLEVRLEELERWAAARPVQTFKPSLGEFNRPT